LVVGLSQYTIGDFDGPYAAQVSWVRGDSECTSSARCRVGGRYAEWFVGRSAHLVFLPSRWALRNARQRGGEERRGEGHTKSGFDVHLACGKDFCFLSPVACRTQRRSVAGVRKICRSVYTLVHLTCNASCACHTSPFLPPQSTLGEKESPRTPTVTTEGCPLASVPPPRLPCAHAPTLRHYHHCRLPTSFQLHHFALPCATLLPPPEILPPSQPAFAYPLFHHLLPSLLPNPIPSHASGDPPSRPTTAPHTLPLSFYTLSPPPLNVLR
jgi:hypothetical protein